MDKVEPQNFIQGRMVFCPWCKAWFPLETFIALQTPPGYENTLPPIYKHGGPDSCKKLFPVLVEA